ncbi:MAG: hypothetical protein K6F55_11960, partial [Eubacterium sp.]|nr:hypothetical protein [Eubacterium sp.]
SVAGFVGRNVILGYLAGVPAVLLFPYLTFKRPFFKADIYGILYRKPTRSFTFLEFMRVPRLLALFF